MPKSVDVYFYYFAYSFMWDVFSVFHYMFDDEATEEVKQKYAVWSMRHSHLANWIADERDFVVDSQEIPESKKEELYSSTESTGDTLITHWGDTLRAAAIEAHKAYPDIERMLWLYYYYCRWLCRTLSVFDQLVSESTSSTSQCFARYQQNRELFTHLATAVVNERPFLGLSHDEQTRREAVLPHAIDSQAMSLVVEWHETIIEAVRTANQDL